MGNTSVKGYSKSRHRRSKHRRSKHRGGLGSSPLNPNPEPVVATSSSTRKKRKGKIGPSLLKLVLKHETKKLYPRGLPGKKSRSSKPAVARNYVVQEEVILVEPKKRRLSI